MPGAHLDTDESIRANTTVERLAELAPVFRPNGTVTAGNSSPLNDGASMVLLGDESAAGAIGREPIARIAARAASAVEPQVFGIGPVEAARVALRRAGIGWADLAAVELNEAFAAQALACLAEWPELDTGIVNTNGGAIAMGHPLGSSGSRILGMTVQPGALPVPGGGLEAPHIDVSFFARGLLNRGVDAAVLPGRGGRERDGPSVVGGGRGPSGHADSRFRRERPRGLAGRILGAAAEDLGSGTLTGLVSVVVAGDANAVAAGG